ncbi:MAG: hypothetical protein KME30_08090 [Iphinoe sp. HA4291-MV1]|jgi:hypothetical protein|nr:hypothetical protein [Iphinoe sp. HA4291-MV1]
MSDTKNATVKARITVDKLNAMPAFDSINELVELSSEQLSHVRGGARGGAATQPGESDKDFSLLGLVFDLLF